MPYALIWPRSFGMLAFWNGLEDHNSDVRRYGNDSSTLCRELVRFDLAIPKFTTLKIVTLGTIRQNLAYLTNYLRWQTAFWTDDNQICSIGRYLDGAINLSFVLRSLKGCCYDSQLILETIRRYCHPPYSFFALAFDNELHDREAIYRRLRGNNSAIYIVYEVDELPSNNLEDYVRR